MNEFIKYVTLLILTALPIVGSSQSNSVETRVIQNRIKEYIEVFKMLKGREQLTSEEKVSIEKMIKNQYEDEIELEKKTKRYGIKVTNQDIQEIMEEGTHPLLLQSGFVNQQTNKFDIILYQKFQSDYKNKKYPPQEEKNYRRIYYLCNYLGRCLRNELLLRKIGDIENRQ